MQKFIVLCALALCAFASALPSDFQNDVILGRRATVAAASPCSCLSSKCTTVAPANGGVGTCKSEYKTTETCSTFSCNTGWQATAKTTSGTCTNGLFSFTACKGEPCKLVAKDVTPSGGAAGGCTDNAAWASGQHCVPKCKLGYVYSGKVQCTATKITTGKCIPATCDYSTAPTNGGVGTCTSTETPSSSSAKTCTPTCNKGYTKTGTTYTCKYPSTAGNSGDTSSKGSVTCAAKTCDMTKQLTDAASLGSCASKTALADGHDCTQTGKTNYVCTKSTCKLGVVTEGKCTKSTCDIKALKGSVSNSEYDTCTDTLESGKSCTMKCKAGYTVANAKQTCTQGSPNHAAALGAAVTCTPNKCKGQDLTAAMKSADNSITGISGSNPTNVAGTWGAFTGSTANVAVNAHATPTCKGGYTASANAICKAGSWTSAKCEKDCTHSSASLTANQNGGSSPACATSGTLGGGKTCNVLCNKGTLCGLVSGVSKCSQHPTQTGKCEDGVFKPAKCVQNTCNFAAVSVKDGSVPSSCKTTAVGQTCAFTCDAGFTASGSMKCNADGTTPSLNSAGNNAKCTPKQCSISSVAGANAVSTSSCSSGSKTAMNGALSTCTVNGCKTDYYMPTGLKVQCDDGKMTCVGCDPTCAPGQSCRGSGAAHCTACRSGWVSKNKKNDGTRTCAVPTSWTKSDHMHVTQTVYFEAAFGTKGNAKSLDHSSNKAKYQGCYAYALGGSTASVNKLSCTSGITSHALPKELTVTVTKASRRGRVTANFVAKYLCPKPVQAACMSKAEAVGKQSTKLTKQFLETNFAYASLAQVEAVLEAKASVTSSASSTSIMAMSSVVAMLAGLFWQ